MEIVYRTGDLLSAPERFIAHGCNDLGKMGKGVAKLIRDRYPWAFAEYENRFKNEGLRLGETIWALPPNDEPHVVINCITQKGYRKTYENDGVRYVDYDAIRACIREIDDTAACQELNTRWLGTSIKSVAFPLIGAGLAGGSWPTIAEIIEREARHFQPVIYTLDGHIPS